MRTLVTLMCVWLVATATISCPVIYHSQIYLVKDGVTRLPVEGATITVMKNNNVVRYYTTDSLGVARGSIYADDDYTVLIKHPEYNSGEGTFRFSKHSRIRFEIQLSVRYRSVIKILQQGELQNADSHVERKKTNSINRISQLLSIDEYYHSFDCRMRHADRIYEQRLKSNDKQYNELLVYPNPVSCGDDFFIECKFGENKILLLLDISGTMVAESDIRFHRKINSAALQPGIYFLKTLDAENNEVSVAKLVVR